MSHNLNCGGGDIGAFPSGVVSQTRSPHRSGQALDEWGDLCAMHIVSRNGARPSPGSGRLRWPLDAKGSDPLTPCFKDAPKRQGCRTRLETFAFHRVYIVALFLGLRAVGYSRVFFCNKNPRAEAPGFRRLSWVSQVHNKYRLK